MNTPTTTLPKQSEHLSLALRALAVNAPDADTQNHLHALATEAYELARSHQTLVEVLDKALTDCEDMIGMIEDYDGMDWGEDGPPFTPCTDELMERHEAARVVLASATR